MKTETKVDIVDYLELYEFKKAYDEGKRFIVKVNYGGVLDRIYMAPKEELTAEMQVLINEYNSKSEKYQSKESAKDYINHLSQHIEDYKSEKIRRDEYIHTLEKKVRDDKDKISSLKSRVEFLIIALISSIGASLISLLW